MKTKFLHFVYAIIILICACERENVNKITNNTIPVNITYQLEDTLTSSFVTYLSVNLYADSSETFFDSISLQANPPLIPSMPDFQPVYKMDYSRFNSNKYIIVKNNFSFVTDTTTAPVIHFDNEGRIKQLNDIYTLATDEYVRDYWTNFLQYQNFSTSSSIWSSISVDGFSSISDMSYNFDVLDANEDSMHVVTGRNHDQTSFDRIYKYTVNFDSRTNNTNIAALCGYISFDFDDVAFFNFGNYNNRATSIYQWLKFIPLPKTNKKLANSIYLTEFMGGAMNNKIVDFTYEFDTVNRITKATIDYSYTGTDPYWSYYLNTKPSVRILFNY